MKPCAFERSFVGVFKKHNPASMRFHIKPYPKKTLKAACATLLPFFPWKFLFSILRYVSFFFFQAYLIGRIILSQVTLRYSVLFNSCRSSIVDFNKEEKKGESTLHLLCLKAQPDVDAYERKETLGQEMIGVGKE